MSKIFSIRIGGMAGDGISSLGEMISKVAIRSSLYVYTYNSYQSVIRGGHVWYQIRVSDAPLKSYGDSIDLLVCMDKDTYTYHAPYLTDNGKIIIDPSKIGEIANNKIISLPMLEIARKFSDKAILQNIVAFGFISAMIGSSWEVIENVIKENFGNKGDKVVSENLNASKAGFDELQHYNLAPIFSDLKPNKIYIMSGNEAIALGALSANCKFLSQYPMTPATSILHWLAEHSEEAGIMVKQTEDELSAINMAIGASYAGARAMVGTSGGGFSLMVEALGLASMIEVPLVIVDSQRTGPSTGLPTKTEQGDLNMLVGASQGDSPRIVLAPGSVEEAFYLTQEAFNLADKYQMPVIIAADLSLSERYESINKLNLQANIDRGLIAQENSPDYKRYEYTETGISHRAFPGMKGDEYVASSDEHDEYGKLVSDVLAGIPYGIEKRVSSMEKRMKKLEHFRGTINYNVFKEGHQTRNLIISWGSTLGVIREAIEEISKEGLYFDHLHLNVVWPINGEKLKEIFGHYENILIIEMNYSSQLGRIITSETGYVFKYKMLKYDGEPLYTKEVVRFVKKNEAFFKKGD